MTKATDYSLGCRLPPLTWAQFNREIAFENADLTQYAAPFPPSALMENVSGLTNERDFASHGADFWIALSAASPQPLTDYRAILDFGCGCGRLARMFKGHSGQVHGCDIDARHVDWMRTNLSHVSATLTEPNRPLPYENAKFDLIVSISVFTHVDEPSQDLLLAELRRVTQPGGVLLLTTHGERALYRAIHEPAIRQMLAVDRDLFESARSRFERNEHAFIRQQGHLTTDDFQYGITFLSHAYIARHWSKWFSVENQRSGAIHDFQDIIVLRTRW
jgi:SAM-dependent methyltransferase